MWTDSTVVYRCGCSHDGCNNREGETFKQMKALFLSLVIALFSMLPGLCSQVEPLIQEVEAPVIKKKVPFKQRHPKIYKAGRKVRTVAIFVSPIVQVTGSVAQIVTPFLLH